MTDSLVCSRCDEEKPRMQSAPMGGAAGEELLANVCGDCWAEWRETSARLINHYGLVLGNPEHRIQLRAAMREFLELDEDD
jgi:Fe-S cluster biosynthesis and repair protein YggX